MFIDNKIPGPNHYACKNLTGFNFNSKYRSSQSYTMGRRFVYKDSRTNYPGPGNYLRFSEFGILVPKRKKEGEGRAVTEGNEKSNENAKNNEETKNNETVDSKEPVKTEA